MHRGLCYRLCPIIYKVVPFYLLFGTTLGEVVPFYLLFGTTLGEGSAILSIVWYYLGQR